MLAYSGQLHTIDETSMFAVTESMVKWGRLDTNQIAWSQWALSPATAQGSLGVGGNVFSKKGLSISLLAVPLYWIGLNLSGVGLVQITMLLKPIITAFTGVIVFLYVRQLGYSTGVSLWVALLFGLSTVAVVYTKVFSSEPVSAMALLLTVYFALRCHGRRALINSSLAGLALGLAVATTAANLITAPFLLLYLSRITYHVSRFTNSLRKHWQERWKHLVFFLASLAIVCLLVGLYNYARFGNPLDSGRRFAKGEAFSTPLWLGLYGFLLSPYKSIFLYSPILLACLVSFPLFFKRHRREGWLFALIVVRVRLGTTLPGAIDTPPGHHFGTPGRGGADTGVATCKAGPGSPDFALHSSTGSGSQCQFCAVRGQAAGDFPRPRDQPGTLRPASAL
jgi:hypothetical protein